MSIQLMQLSLIVVYAILLFSAYYFKSKYVKGLALLGVVIIFTMNPMRFKQTGGGFLEREVSRFDNVPEKVIVRQESFEDSQKKELDNLTKQSKGLKDEIHN